MVIAQILSREIETKRMKIQNNPDYYLRRSNRVKRNLRAICDVYSFWLENPALRGKILTLNGGVTPRQLRTKARKSIKQIHNAWNYLTNVSWGSDFVADLTPEVILHVGKLVDPQNLGYRRDRVYLNLAYTPPNPLKVPDLVEQFCRDLKASDYDSVESAAVAHLHLAGIQPFNDGNKRTARLIQDRILSDVGLPPAIIPAGEREVYIDLLEQGLIGMRDKNLRLQRPFFDYIGGKVNVALDEILNDLRSI